MFDVTSPSDPVDDSGEPLLQRTRGEARCAFARREGATVLSALRQEGSLKVRFPRSEAGSPAEAVLLNTAGGLTDGDVLTFAGATEPGADVVFSTQASERIYRSRGGSATVETRLSIGRSARLGWLPQETILFNGARLERTLDVDIEPTGTFLAHEATVFGRTAMGETVKVGLFNDRWRVRVDGRMIHADAVRIEGDIAKQLARPGFLGGASAMATVLLIGDGAETHLAAVRAILDGLPKDVALAGASAWNGKLVLRAVAHSGAHLRTLITPVLHALQQGRGLPRVWTI